MESIKNSIRTNLQIHRQLTEVKEVDEVNPPLSTRTQENSESVNFIITQPIPQKKVGVKKGGGKTWDILSSESLKRLQQRTHQQTIKKTQKVEPNIKRRSEQQIQNLRHRKELMYRSAEHNKYRTEIILAENPLPNHSLFPLT